MAKENLLRRGASNFFFSKTLQMRRTSTSKSSVQTKAIQTFNFVAYAMNMEPTNCSTNVFVASGWNSWKLHL
jgi:hypothetical protein